MPVYPEFGPESRMGVGAVSAWGPEHSMGAEGLLWGDLQSGQHQELAGEEHSGHGLSRHTLVSFALVSLAALYRDTSGFQYFPSKQERWPEFSYRSREDLYGCFWLKFTEFKPRLDWAWSAALELPAGTQSLGGTELELLYTSPTGTYMDQRPLSC